VNESRPLPLWAGRTVALLGILLVALTLRQAVAAISPILAEIEVDIPLTSIGIGILGMLPPVLFAASGFLTPVIARRIGLERALVLALALMFVGHIVRGIAPNYVLLVVGSMVALLGMGLGNVLLPPVVRRYFPDRVGLVTAIYIGTLSLSTSIPSLLAAPLAEGIGWRFSLGIWSLTAVLAVVPWLIVLARHKRALDAGAVVESPPASLVGRLWRSRVALAVTLTLAVSTVNMYAGFAWLPEILSDLTGSDQAQSGLYLAIFGFVGLPGAIVAPLLVSRLRNVGWIIVFGVVVFVIGYAGLLLMPGTATVVWVICLGVAPILFPVSLALVNRRTRTHEGAIALSGFAQGIAYAIGALGPLIVGGLHDATGSWNPPLLFLFGWSLTALVAAALLARPAYVEDELARV
jgi:CP family cyanate transporter-like MFS transporter